MFKGAAAPTQRFLITAASAPLHQVERFVYLGGLVESDGSVGRDIARRRSRAFIAFRKHREVVYRRKNIRLDVKVALYKGQVLETALYGCQTWAMGIQHYAALRSSHHHQLLQLVGFRKKDPTQHSLSYSDTLRRVDCESIETTIRRRRLIWVGRIRRMHMIVCPRS